MANRLKLVIGMSNNTFLKGFSLIEIMVVIVIIGITITFAMLSFSHIGEQELCKKNAQKLTHFLGLVRQQAILSKKPLGVVINNDEYYAVNVQGKIKKLRQSPLLKHHRLPKKIKLVITPPPHLDKINSPNLIVQASGEYSKFIITFLMEDKAYYRIENVKGHVEMMELSDENK